MIEEIDKSIIPEIAGMVIVCVSVLNAWYMWHLHMRHKQKWYARAQVLAWGGAALCQLLSAIFPAFLSGRWSLGLIFVGMVLTVVSARTRDRWLRKQARAEIMKDEENSKGEG